MTKVMSMVFTSGQLPINRETGMVPTSIEEQTKQSIENVISVLKENNMDLSNVIKSTVYLSDIDNFKAMNEIYSIYFQEPYPARSAFEVAKLPLNVLVEIEVIAAIWI